MTSHEGFTGTVPEFIGWLRGILPHTEITIDSPEYVPVKFEPSRLVRKVILTSAHHEDEDRFMALRLSQSLFAQSFRSAEPSGAQRVFLIPVTQYDSPEPRQWLDALSLLEEASRL